jgi:hypothetical protein
MKAKRGTLDIHVKRIHGRLTAFCCISGDGLWRPVVELQQGYKTQSAAIRAGRRALKEAFAGMTVMEDHVLRKLELKRKRRANSAREP